MLHLPWKIHFILETFCFEIVWFIICLERLTDGLSFFSPRYFLFFYSNFSRIKRLNIIWPAQYCPSNANFFSIHVLLCAFLQYAGICTQKLKYHLRSNLIDWDFFVFRLFFFYVRKRFLTLQTVLAVKTNEPTVMNRTIQQKAFELRVFDDTKLGGSKSSAFGKPFPPNVIYWVLVCALALSQKRKSKPCENPELRTSIFFYYKHSSP